MRTFDFQVHSKFSFDSLNNFDKIKKRCKQKGIDGVAITDHNTLKGGLASRKFSDENFLFIPGQEVDTDFGDVIGLMIQDEIKSKNFYEVIDEIKNQGGISYLPHPSRKCNLSINQIKKNIDVIEAVNGRSAKRDNLKSSKLAFSLDLPYASGSDAHTIREIGKTKTVFSERFTNESSLTKILLNKNIERTITGLGSYEIINHIQSSLVGTIKTGKVKQFAEGVLGKFF